MPLEALTPLTPLSQRERGEKKRHFLSLSFSLLSLWERRAGGVRASRAGRLLLPSALLIRLFLSTPSYAQEASALPDDVRSAAAALHQAALAGTRAYDIVRSLTVEVGPRPAGSKAHDAAVAWGLRTLKEL